MQGRPVDPQGRFVPAVPPDVTNRLRFIGVPGGGRPPGIAESSPFARMIFPPRIEKLQSSQDFQAVDFAVALPAGAGSQATSANLIFQIPQTSVGWLQEFSLYTLSQTALTSVQFTLRVNQSAVPGFGNLQNPPGVANLVLIDKNDLRIRVPNNGTVDVLFTNLNANGPWTVGARFAGWFHSWDEEEAVFGHTY